MSARRTLGGVPPELEQATYAVAGAAEERGCDLTWEDAMTLARAALTSFDRLVVVEDETSVGMWGVDETREAVRRRLRDRAAVQALDEGCTVTACEREVVAGLGPAGETLPLGEAACAVVTHTYRARFLLAGAVDPAVAVAAGATEVPPISVVAATSAFGPRPLRR